MTGTHLWARLVSTAATPTPSPSPGAPPTDMVTPGVIGFVVIFALAIVTILLLLDMNRRIRRARYRDEIASRLDDEQRDDDDDEGGKPR